MILRDNDPSTGPSFTFSNRAARACWGVVWLLFFRLSPRPLHAWRAALLRLFGAQVGKYVHVYPGVRIWAPWNLRLGDRVGIGDGVYLYSMALIDIGDRTVVSQGAHLCCGSHDYNSANFQLFARPIKLGNDVWICTEAFLGPGVEVAEGVVIGARSVATRSISDSWCVFAGNPCKAIGRRSKHPGRNEFGSGKSTVMER